MYFFNATYPRRAKRIAPSQKASFSYKYPSPFPNHNAVRSPLPANRGLKSNLHSLFLRGVPSPYPALNRLCPPPSRGRYK